MPRRRRLRRIVAPPRFKGYKPYGVAKSATEFVELFYEEYEAIKLSDYESMNHETAANMMGVSRPTFARIYESARRKIAEAMVEVKEIRTVYGNAFLDKTWYVCNGCNARFTVPRQVKTNSCALCASDNIEPLGGEGV